MAARYSSDESNDSSEDKDREHCGIMQLFQRIMDKLQKELDELKQETHPEFVRRIKKLETERNERLELNAINRSTLEERVDRDFEIEIKAAQEEFDKKQNDLVNKLIAECEERRKLVEYEHQTMKLVDDAVEARTRMSQRIANIPVRPMTVVAPLQPRAIAKHSKPKRLALMLKDEEIEDDLRMITGGMTAGPSGVTAGPSEMTAGPSAMTAGPSGMTAGPSRSPSLSTDVNDDEMSSDFLVMWPTDAQILAETKIEDGKLFYEGRWYRQNDAVNVEVSDMPMFGALISAIGVETVWVKNTVNKRKVQICVSQLVEGKVSIKRSSSESKNFHKYV